MPQETRPFSGRIGATLALLLLALPARSAQLRVLHLFRGGSDGAIPFPVLVRHGDALYGVTNSGGGHGRLDGAGTIYKLDHNGVETVVHAFNGGADGVHPSDLTSFAGAIYGVTGGGGAGCGQFGCGTVFRITPPGATETIYRFQGGSDGATPISLVAWQGSLYGATQHGGGTGCDLNLGCGTLFRMTPAGDETILQRFGETDPSEGAGSLIATADSLYGLASYSVFSVDGGGKIQTVFPFPHKISYVNGLEVPPKGPWRDEIGHYATSLAALDGRLYFSTEDGGHGNCLGNGCGAIIALTLSGNATLLSDFHGGADGAMPGRLLTAGGVIYGTSSQGGTGGNGTFFRVTPAGAPNTVLQFPAGPMWRNAALALIDTNGTIYGMSEAALFEILP